MVLVWFIVTFHDVPFQESLTSTTRFSCIQRHGGDDKGGCLVKQHALDRRLKSTRVAVREARKLVGRVQLAGVLTLQIHTRHTGGG